MVDFTGKTLVCVQFISKRLGSWLGIPSWPEKLSNTAYSSQMLLLNKALQIPIMEEKKPLYLYSR